MALGSTQPLTEMSTRNILGGKGWPACSAEYRRETLLTESSCLVYVCELSEHACVL
jgi:hypothetical protein